MRVGVDIGGTKISCVLVDDTNSVVKKYRMHNEKERLFENVCACIQAVWMDGVRGIGVSCAGYFHNDMLVGGENVAPLQNIPFLASLKERFGVIVKAENDANCFILAEQQFGVAKNTKNVIGIIQGTGVGAGIIINNALIRGVSGSFGELGNMRLLDGSDWESHISGPAISALYATHGGTPNTRPDTIWQAQDAAGKKTREILVQQMGLFLASIINAFNPEMIVLGGGVANLPDTYYVQIAAAAKPHCVPYAYDACKIVRFGVSDDAGSLGAAMLLE